MTLGLIFVKFCQNGAKMLGLKEKALFMKVVNASKFDIKNCPTDYEGKKLNKVKGKELLKERISKLSEIQERFYADGRRALLIIFQAMDAAGKDSTIEKVFSGLNPQGCEVTNFKAPTAEELRHDFMWRCLKELPAQGKIGIFNRSYYEEVLVVKVHPDFLQAQSLPKEATHNLWEHRYEDINNIEKYLTRNGVIILKFMLNVSKEEQAKRFIERATRAEKNWKVGIYDLKERLLWNDYMKAYNEMVRKTSTEFAPWHIIPSDDKWYAHLRVIDTIIETVEKLDIEYPKPDAKQMLAIEEVKKELNKFLKEEVTVKKKK